LIKQTRASEQLSFLFDADDIFTGVMSQVTHGELPFDTSVASYVGINMGVNFVIIKNKKMGS
jgi:hypothetical protein